MDKNCNSFSIFTSSSECLYACNLLRVIQRKKRNFDNALNSYFFYLSSSCSLLYTNICI